MLLSLSLSIKNNNRNNSKSINNNNNLEPYITNSNIYRATKSTLKNRNTLSDMVEMIREFDRIILRIKVALQRQTEQTFLNKTCSKVVQYRTDLNRKPWGAHMLRHMGMCHSKR